MAFFFSLFYFLVGGKTPDPVMLKNMRTYKDIVEEQVLHRDQVWAYILFNPLLSPKIPETNHVGLPSLFAP